MYSLEASAWFTEPWAPPSARRNPGGGAASPTGNTYADDFVQRVAYQGLFGKEDLHSGELHRLVRNALDGRPCLRPRRRCQRRRRRRLDNGAVRNGINKCRSKVLVAGSWHGLDARVPDMEVCVDRPGHLRAQLGEAGGTKCGGAYSGGERWASTETLCSRDANTCPNEVGVGALSVTVIEVSFRNRGR